jgi:hypothetical protein
MTHVPDSLRLLLIYAACIVVPMILAASVHWTPAQPASPRNSAPEASAGSQHSAAVTTDTILDTPAALAAETTPIMPLPAPGGSEQ